MNTYETKDFKWASRLSKIMLSIRELTERENELMAQVYGTIGSMNEKARQLLDNGIISSYRKLQPRKYLPTALFYPYTLTKFCHLDVQLFQKVQLGLMWRRVKPGFGIGSDRHINP